MRDMSTFEEAYREKGVEFVAVNVFEPPEQARRASAELGLPFRYARADRATIDAWGIRGVPSQILLDRQGRVIWTSSLGSLTRGSGAIREALDRALE